MARVSLISVSDWNQSESKGKIEVSKQTIAVEFTWRWKINNPNWYCGSKVVNERVKRKLQDLTILNLKSFLSDENMQNATHLEKWTIVILPAPLYIFNGYSIFFIVYPQLELLKHKYKKVQNNDQRYPCAGNVSTGDLRFDGCGDPSSIPPIIRYHSWKFTLRLLPTWKFGLSPLKIYVHS